MSVCKMMGSIFRKFIIQRSYISICSTRQFSVNLSDVEANIGKQTGCGGSIREAGGGMGLVAVAKEEEYFYKKQKEQLEKLKEDLSCEIEFHEQQIKKHEEAIAHHRQRIYDIGS